MQVDPDFAKLRARSRARERQRRLRRWLPVAVLVIAGVGAGGAWVSRHGVPDNPLTGSPRDEPQLVQVEGQFQVAPVVHADTFGNIPGDPLILPAGDAAGTGGKKLAGPAGLAANRAGPPGPERLDLVSEALYVRDRRFMTALPTTRQDFALFQSQRARAARIDTLAPITAPRPIDPLTDPLADPLALRGDSGSATLYLRDSAARQPAWEDLALAVDVPTPLAALLTTHGWLPETAEITARNAAAALPALADPLPAGSILALRWRPEAGGRRVMQMSVYGPAGYLGTLAAAEGAGGRLIAGTDPWLSTDLRELAGDGAGPAGQFRLLDAIYSAALRKGIGTEQVAEIIAMLSRVYDLDAVATDGDRLTLIMAKDPPPDASPAAGVLFVGLQGPSGTKACYVIPDDQGGYRCYAPGARLAAVAMPAMSAPVDGVIQSRFGDAGRHDMVWTAADGAAVTAPAAGLVTRLVPDDGAVMVEIDHGDGWMTRLSGLGTAEKGIAQGAPVAAGAAIGRMAQPKGKAQPALAFQLSLRGVAMDPMPALSGGQVVLGSDAVETLIARIIHVESGGNARARNPLSTASGLGQFIESTWLRMMRSYRPDLVASLTRQQLLDLRFDAAMSTEMVRHLAQENETYLRTRGHAITPGRLYLAHFLGPEGANIALSAAPGQSVGAVMGGAVVRANPFLTNYSTTDLIAWAERKMTGRAPPMIPMASEPPLAPAVQSYVAAITALLRDEGISPDTAGSAG